VKVSTEICLFPYGAREGLPAAALDITGDGELPTMTEVLGPLSEVTRPGVVTLWLRTIPWGSYEVDKRIADWTYAMPHMVAVATADAATTEWSNLQNIGWVLDVTALVEQPTTAQALQSETVARATMYLPAVQEIVAQRVDSSNLMPGTLAALANMFNCDNGTIYVTEEQRRAALVAVSSAGIFAARVR
jgi:hypothetical protein